MEGWRRAGQGKQRRGEKGDEMMKRELRKDEDVEETAGGEGKEIRGGPEW